MKFTPQFENGNRPSEQAPNLKEGDPIELLGHDTGSNPIADGTMATVLKVYPSRDGYQIAIRLDDGRELTLGSNQ